MECGSRPAIQDRPVVGLPVQENHTDCSRVAQHALVLVSSDHVKSDPTVPAHSPPFNRTPHRNLSNLNLHAWLLEPQQSRGRASLRQWQHELRLLKGDQPDQSMRQSGAFFTKWYLSNQVGSYDPRL